MALTPRNRLAIAAVMSLLTVTYDRNDGAATGGAFTFDAICNPT